MATWQDGPEYAPLERPDDFLVPPHPPLSEAAPYDQQARLAPRERPVFADPPVPVAPLATLVPVAEDVRDPALPFAVVSTAATPSATQNAWSAVHWNPPAGPPSATWGPPGGIAVAHRPPAEPPAVDAPVGAWPPPTAPFHLSREQAAHTAFPVPGTPGWFAPPPPPRPSGPPPSVRLQDVIAGLTPGLLICLALGAIIHLLAPLTLSIAALLAARAQITRGTLKAVFGVALGLLMLVAGLLLLVDGIGFDGWWSALGWTALAISWILLVVLPLIVVGALRRGERPQPRDAAWG